MNMVKQVRDILTLLKPGMLFSLFLVSSALAFPPIFMGREGVLLFATIYVSWNLSVQSRIEEVGHLGDGRSIRRLIALPFVFSVFFVAFFGTKDINLSQPSIVQLITVACSIYLVFAWFLSAWCTSKLIDRIEGDQGAGATSIFFQLCFWPIGVWSVVPRYQSILKIKGSE